MLITSIADQMSGTLGKMGAFSFIHVRRLSLNATVDLKKLRFFSIPHDSGSVWVHPVSKELMEIQKKVRRMLK